MAGVPAGRLSIEIVAEIARLQQDLDKAKRAVNAASKDMAQSVTAVNDNFGRMAKMSGNAAFAARNLGFQVQDVITQLSLGQAPMKVFAAQGFQIADALGQLKREAAASGQSVSSMLIGSMGKLGPLLLAAAAAAIAVGGALKVVQDDLNETGKVTLSYGDVALGTFDAIRAFTVDKLGPAFEWLASIAGTVWGYIADAAKKAANLVISVWVAVPNVLYAAFTTLPAAIAELFVNMANGAIKAIEDLVNKAINGLNSFSGMVNSLLGTSIGGVGNVSFGRIENNFKGAGSRAGAAMGKALTESFGDHVGAIESYIRPFAEARARMGDAAVKAGKAAGAKGGRAGGKAAAEAMAETWADELAKDLAQTMAGFSKELDKIVDGIMKLSDADLDKALADAARKGEAEFAQLNDEIQRTLEQVDALIGSLGRMRGLGGLFGDIGNVLTSKNPIASMLGMGGVGTILGSVLGGQDITEKMGTEFTKSIKTTFPGLNDELAGKIGSTMAGIFQGSAIGGSVGGIMGGGKNAQLGSQVGGIAGQALGSTIGALGAFGGPIGAIAGAILGNVLGGLTQATKRGGATIGAGGISGTWGNSQSRIGASSDLGANAVSALEQLASALGATLGAFSSSISMREGNLRFDPTGSGISKTSKGAINFGQDEEALLKAVIKDAISDGAFEGLSQGFKDYLTSGDVESRLQDVLNIKAVMNEAASMRDPTGSALGELDTWKTSMMAIATATGEGMADIEYVYGKKREEILAAANDNIVDLTNERTALLIQIAELEGRSTEALVMARELELSTTDESLRPLMQRIYALQDEAVVAAAAAAIANERFGLEGRLMQLQGDTAGLRQRELDALDPVNRGLQQSIFAFEDLQKATEAANKATSDAAAIADERASIERAIHEHLGNTSYLRMQELDALDPANRALKQHYFNLLDQAAAANEAASATSDLAARQRAIADERYGLETRLLQAMGATDALRAREIAELDESNRPLLRQIFAIEDYKVAQEAAAVAAQEAADATIKQNNALIDSYNDQASAVGQLAATFRDIAQEIRGYRSGLFSSSPGAAQGEFGRISRMAAMGDESSLRAFTGAADGYLEQARRGASTLVEYQRAIGLVARAADQAANGADGVAAMAEQQFAAMQQQVASLQFANELAQLEADAAKTRADANIAALAGIEAMQEATISEINIAADTSAETLQGLKDSIDSLRQQIAAQRAEEQGEAIASISALNDVSRRLARWDGGDYVRVGNDADTPVTTVAA